MADYLYFKASTDVNWNHIHNWWEDDDCTTTQAEHVPWTTGDDKYLAYYLVYGSGTDAVLLNANILATVTGSCSLTIEGGGGPIMGGTFTCIDFYSTASIYGGTFTGSGFYQNSGIIYGGTFTGSGFINYMGTIYGGTFEGTGFENYNNIYGGIFTCATFLNVSEVYGGIISCADWGNFGGSPHGFWWLSGRIKSGSTIVSSSASALPQGVYFSILYTDDCQLTTDKILTGSSVTELGVTVDGSLNVNYTY